MTRVMDDLELLHSYASEQREESFKSLMERHVSLVYSSAWRQTGNAEMAKDVTQAVFLVLAAKAHSLPQGTVLAGWLLRTTRYAAANALRLEQRRDHYEQEAMKSLVASSQSEAAWQQMAPLLDEAMESLGEKDRDVVVLRFFEQLPLRQVAERIGVSEDGAQKRVSRALERLKAFFSRRGRVLSVAAIASALTPNVAQSAPVDVLEQLAAGLGGSQALVNSVARRLCNATMQTMMQDRFKVLSVRAIAVAALISLVFVVLQPFGKTPVAPSPVSPDSLIADANRHPTAVEAAQAVLPSPAPTAVPPETRQLRLQVVDARTESPVANARLTLVSVVEGRRRSTNNFATDAVGVGLVSYSPIPVKGWNHRIEVFRDGYVPKYLSWSENQQDAIDDIPDRYTLKVDPAVKIGGVTLDEQQRPVAGVKIVFSVSGPTPSRARERTTMMGGYHFEMSGADGRWSCTHVPRAFGMISFRTVHPDFMEKEWLPDSPESSAYLGVDRLPVEDFLSQRALMVMKRGMVVAGFVNDEGGHPVSGARVTQNFEFGHPMKSVLSGPDGSFHFGNLGPGDLTLTVQITNLAPVVSSLTIHESVEDIRVTLPAGKRLKGRVVDDQGQPIARASIQAASPSSDSRTLFEFKTYTDEQGRFEWGSAPAVQHYAVQAGGFEPEEAVRLSAGSVEHTIKLRRKSNLSIQLTGQVVDAETLQPPQGVKVQIWQTRNEPGGGQSSFTTLPEAIAPDGQFRMKTDEGTVQYVLEVQADGYLPVRQTNHVAGPGALHHEVALVRATPAVGRVLTPQGSPADGALFVLCAQNEYALMTRSGTIAIANATSETGGFQTDETGRFRLPNKYAPEVLVLAHPTGFAQVPFSNIASNTVVSLQPWSRLEGSLNLGGKPQIGATIQLVSNGGKGPQPSRFSLYLESPTDESGHFTFEKIPPGEWYVAHNVNASRPGNTDWKMPVQSHGLPVIVRPGVTETVTIGGGGSVVIGKAVAPSPVNTSVWTGNVVTLSLKGDQPKIVVQDQRAYCALFSPDGSFRVEDVPSGKYSLKIDLSGLAVPSGNRRLPDASLGRIEMDFEVPGSLSSGDSPPVQLGEIRLLGESTSASNR